MRSTLVLTAAFIMCASDPVHAQCLLYEPFDGSSIPPGWDAGAQVEILDQDGNGTGVFIDAWRIGNAGDANANGFLPVPDVPVWNSLVMANDDADPCDCDMDAVALRSPAIDLSGATNAGIEFRAYHDGLFNGGAFVVQASTDGSIWTDILQVTERTGQWQRVIGDLSAWDGQPVVYVRFTWSDNGQWATGVALDDVCVFSRADHDLAIIASMTGDPRVDPLDTSSRTQHYAILSLGQAGPVTLSAIVINRGAQDMTQVILSADLFQDGVPQGSYSSDPIATLASGAVDTLFLNTAWTPPVVGLVSAEITVSAADPDDVPSDNDAIVMQRITGIGTPAGNSATAIDNDAAESSYALGSTERSVGNRFELIGNGSSIYVVSALLDGPNTTVGAVIQGMVLDGLFNELALTDPDTVTQADIDASASGIPMFMFLDEPLLIDQDMDVYALAGSVAGSAPVSIAAGGFVDRGTAAFWEPSAGTLEFLQRPPMVRLHFDVPAVGIRPSTSEDPGLRLYPQPADDQVMVEGAGTDARLVLFDTQGRKILERWVTGGRELVDTHALPAGCYHLLVERDRSRASATLVVVH